MILIISKPPSPVVEASIWFNVEISRAVETVAGSVSQALGTGLTGNVPLKSEKRLSTRVCRTV